ncbi:RNA polymerase sigma-70 factor (sigma-E family) [Streptacidiphilus sp. MAP12-20]|uniref:SigE family RNA polymerase sigma factor n=1 Tax=Streptacidiphilus sp. MAP12-20 TaxID=3156299 RepID=UPI003512E6B3
MDPHLETEFRDFVESRWQPLLRTAYLLTGDHGLAEELLQTALVRTHRRWRQIERSDAPEVYVRKVLVNLHRTWWRRARRREDPTGTVPERVDLTADSHDAYAAYERRDELWRAVLALPPRMRAALVLRYFEDLPEAEVARILDCSLGTVKSQTSRGLDRLRTAYETRRDS